jgi:hypothetical protein
MDVKEARAAKTIGIPPNCKPILRRPAILCYPPSLRFRDEYGILVNCTSCNGARLLPPLFPSARQPRTTLGIHLKELSDRPENKPLHTRVTYTRPKIVLQSVYARL